MADDLKHRKIKRTLSPEDFLRIEFYFNKKTGKIIKFSLQYEALIENSTQIIMRIDNFHKSTPHQHTYYKNKKQTKTHFNSSPHSAFNEGQQFIRLNFIKIKENYLFVS